jgi:type I phosphodiesterase/nucleotide pyrophosphatase
MPPCPLLSRLGRCTGLLGALAAGACQSATSAPPAERAGDARAAPPSEPGAASREKAARPRVVVAVVIDQLGSDTLLTNLELLDPKGAIRRAIDGGVYLERSEYSYANTLTAPGHVAVFTGAAPITSGIDGNSEWDTARARAIPVTEDSAWPVFGRAPGSPGASSVRLRVPTVAHALRAATNGAAKVISLSAKERSAILPVATAADLVLWYDAASGSFTSSTLWGAALPAWLGAYQAEHPVRELMQPWTAERPELYRARLGPDDAPGEGDIAGFGVTFPHRLDRVKDPLALVQSTPAMSEYLVALAETAARESHVGEDDITDLIALSISGTDAVGHVFGPGSWEYVDHLIKADRALGAWLDRLERQGPIAVLITSDHGSAPLAETRATDGGRTSPPRLKQQVEAALAKQWGSGPWVASVSSPFVYLVEPTRRHPDRALMLQVARSALVADPAIANAWTLERVRGFGEADPLERALRASVASDNEADLMFLTRPYHPLEISDLPGRGTNHGSPYDYDRQVPVLAWGTLVPRSRVSTPVDQMRVAATIARLLGVPAPGAAPREPLF